MTLIVLAVILAALLIAVCGKRGAKTIATLTVNLLIFFGMAAAILNGMNSILAALIACLLICVTSLFFNCGVNAKSISCFASVFCVVVLLGAVISVFGRGARIEGFSFQKLSQIAGYSWIIDVDMGDLTVAVILVGLIGAVVDTSIAVASAQFEVAYNNPDIGFAELYRSGIKVGRDVLGTTCNTLYFAYLGGYMALIIWFILYKFSLGTVINSAAFVETVIRSMTSAFGCVLIMPVTSLFTAALLKTKAKAIVSIAEKKKADLGEYLNREPDDGDIIDAELYDDEKEDRR
ncbi:MAG: YibE/F family protein [Clostridia bacterium]|nr:YibE/F family protein [Clostridia bacterium]